jgi:class 3 adenylate cyclase
VDVRFPIGGKERRFGGFTAKYMGDGVLLYFGYPQAHEDDAERVKPGRDGVAMRAAFFGFGYARIAAISLYWEVAIRRGDQDTTVRLNIS